MLCEYYVRNLIKQRHSILKQVNYNLMITIKAQYLPGDVKKKTIKKVSLATMTRKTSFNIA